ncbi:Sulfhydryl oxidase [Quillaja saponaria]|uniref:Sulfhydryl oxidase n=1 Tax=Quillaja saponaria TaxID=32244 RepID=A0AAD7PJT2_QUISA|nr:Sulfhydryl oxidase [Quillaja saponaria]
MKVSEFWILFLMAGATFTFLNFSSSISCSFYPDIVFTNSGDGMMAATSRKLKGYGNSVIDKKRGDIGDVNLDDYQPIDPVPSSKASVKPGPIEHGTPLMPFIPKPSPPAHPEPGDAN